MPRLTSPLQILLIACFVAAIFPSFAQNSNAARNDIAAQNYFTLHLSLGPAYIIPTGGFINIADMPAPPDGLDFSSSANAFQFWGTIGADYHTSQQFALGASFSYRPQKMSFVAAEQTVIATEGGGTRNATLQHDLIMSIQTFSIEPYGRYEFSDAIGFQFGVPISIPIGNDYTQTQFFSDPPGLTFVDGSIEQTTGQGEMPHIPSVVIGISPRIDAMLPLTSDRNLLLTPQLGAVLQLASWSTAASVFTVTIEGGIGIRYQLFAAKPIPEKIRDTTYVRDTVTMLSASVAQPTTERISAESEVFESSDSIRVVVHERYHLVIPKPPAVLAASLALAFESTDGTISPEARLRVNKVERTRVVPILPVVVFDAFQRELPARYVQLTQQQATRYREHIALRNPSSHWQYHVLNVVGLRMKKASSKNISVVGIHNITAEGAALAKDRAEAVKQYLCSTFGLKLNRVKVELREVDASQQSWVLLSDESHSLTSPIEAMDTITETVLPSVRMVPEVVTELGVKSWRVYMDQNTINIHTMNGFGDVPQLLTWDMNSSVTPDRVFGTPIDIVLDVEDKEGGKARSAPGRVSLLGPMAMETPSVSMERTEVLHVLAPEVLYTTKEELFGSTKNLTRTDHTNSASWTRTHLQEPELSLYTNIEVYTNEKRRP